MKTSPVPFATLLAQLADPDPNVRCQSTREIMRRPQERTQAFPSLLSLLADPDELVRLAAVEALGQLGDSRALPVLQPLLTDLKQRDRLSLAALRALVRLDPLSSLRLALQDPTPLVHQQALHELGMLGDGRAIEPLLAALLSDGREWVRKGAADALGLLGDARAVEPLLAALGDTERGNQYAAIALGRLGDARAVEPLIAALSEGDDWVRREAAFALGKLGDLRAVEPLIALLSDADSWV